MSNLIFGNVTILFSAIIYFYSWRFEAKDNYKLAILFLIIAGLALRIYTASDFFLHTWDERYHALVAKNLIQHPLLPTLYENPLLPFDYKSWSSNHIWLHKQPLPLWMMSISMYLFGINEVALRLPSVILSTIGILLTFSIASYFFNKKSAFIAAFLFSINGLIIEMAGGRIATDHIDIFFMFFIELAIYFSVVYAQKEKSLYNILVGVSIAAAILSKWLPALIVLPIWLLIVIDSNKFKPKTIILQFLLIVTCCLLVFLPWQLYIFHTFPLEANWEANLNYRHITEVLDEQGGPFYYFLDRMRINYGELIYLPLAWFLWKTVKRPSDYKRLAIAFWIVIPLLFFSIALTKMQSYILFISPALFIITAQFWGMLSVYKINHKPVWLYNLILFLLIALPIRYTIERTKPFDITDRCSQWVSDLKKLNERNIQRGVLFNYDKPIEAMFYTNLTVYSYVPEKNVLTDLIHQGYTVLINDNGNIKSEIKSLKDVKIETFQTQY